MADLIVEHDGQRFRFDGTKPVLIGRDAGADVVCASPAVSRQHVEVSLDGGRWMIVDRSSLGTFVDQQKISRRALDRPVTLLLGDPASGESVRLSVDDPFARPMRAEHETVQLSADFVGRVDALQVRHGDRTVSVRAGEELTIGRDATNGLVIDDPIVSRHHARIAQRGDRWVLSDVGSSRGTYVDGKRVPHHDLVGKVSVHLGDPAGPEIACSLGERQRKSDVTVKKRTLKWAIPAALVVLVLLGGLAALLLGGGDDGPGLDRAKQAMVWLEVSYPDQEGATTGSGTMLTKDGLILTSAHVVAKDAPGLAPSYPSGDPAASRIRSQAPTEIVVYTYVSDDRMERAYRATTVDVDGYLDLAVIKIDSTADGASVDADKLDLPHTGLGDSGKVASGDSLTVLGFPEQEHANSVTVAPESVSGFQADSEGLVKDRRAWIMGSSPKVTPGSSGGALVDEDGRVVGVTIQIDPERSQVFYRPSALAEPLVDAAKDGSSGGYATYRYVKKAEPGVQASLVGVSRTPDCPTKPTDPVLHRTTGVPVVCVDFAGVTPGQALWVAVSGSEESDGDELGGAWQLFTPANLADSGSGTAAFSVSLPPEALADPELGAVWIRVYAGPSFDDLRSVSKSYPILLKSG